MDQKWDMLACHKSQKEWLDVSQGMNAYLNVMKDFAADMGQRSGKFKICGRVPASLVAGLFEQRD